MKFLAKPFLLFFSAISRTYRFFRSIILNLFFIFIVLAVAGTLVGTPALPIPDEAILVLNPRGTLKEQSSTVSTPQQLLSSNPAGNQEVLLEDLLEVIYEAASDDRITAMIIEPEGLEGAAFSHLQETGAALSVFRASGKPVYAMSGNYTQAQYYLASFAEKIMLNPMGTVDLQGFGSWQIYFRQALDTLGINAHVFRVGIYKAAVEPYESNGMSAEARQNYGELFGDLWDMYLRDVSEHRNLPQNALSELIETYDVALARYSGDAAALALGEGLVDMIGSHASNIKFIDTTLTGSDESLPRVEFERYLGAAGNLHKSNPDAPRIGLITASGEIRDGEAPRGSIGGATLGDLIHEATKNDELAALVLRINSPGGSAFASELIREELEAFKATGRPLLVSMGSVAASGGYWIATPADEIWATASTITGSIGIYGVLPTFEDAFSKLGLTLDGTGTTSLSGVGTPGKALNPLAERSLQLTIEAGYNRFLTLVSGSRGISMEAADAIAQGQVWSGMRALNNGLVDHLGNLQQTLDAAADRAGIEDYQVIALEKPLTPFEQIMASVEQSQRMTQAVRWFAGQDQKLTLSPLVEPLLQLFTAPAFLNDPNALYLHCDTCSAVSY